MAAAFVRSKGAGIIVQHDVRKPAIVQPSALSPAIVKRLDRINVTTKASIQLSSMTKARAGFALYPYLTTKLIAIGGTDGSVIHGNAEIYTIGSDTWAAATSPQTARCYFQSVQVSNKIYCIGGITSDGFGNLNISKSVEVYDPSLNSWATLTSMPDGYGVAMGVAVSISGVIYVLSGYRDTINTSNTFILSYTIGSDTWAVSSELSSDDQQIYRRQLPFVFVNGTAAYVMDGIYYHSDISQGVTSIYQSNSYKFDSTNLTISQSDRSFRDLPASRFGGASASSVTANYFVGGANDISNSLRYFDEIDTTSSPFPFTSTDALSKGRSSLGCAISSGFAYVAGGVSSPFGNTYLKIDISAIPDTIQLNGKQTGAVDIYVSNENGDAPSSVQVKISAAYTTSGSNAVLFTEDEITVTNGYGMATLIPRADDGTESDYSVSISATVIDPAYIGQSDPVLLPPPDPGLSSTDPSQSLGVVNLPAGITDVGEYDSVVLPSQATQGAYLQLKTIAGFLALTPTFQPGTTTSVHWTSGITWLPVVKDIIDDNQGTTERVRDALNRLSRQDPFGGSTILDAVAQAAKILSLDVSEAKPVIYLQTDGQEHYSHYSVDDVNNLLHSISPNSPVPVISSVFRVVPSFLHLDQGIRSGSDVTDQLAATTQGSVVYVTTDNDLEENLDALLVSQGFIGSGTFVFQIDLGEEVLIQSLQGVFSILDSETSAYWKYAIGDDTQHFGLLSERIEADVTLTLQQTYGRYVKIVAYFYANLTTDLYNAEKIIPPKLEAFNIVYHKKTASYIYFNKKVETDALHQIVVAIDANRPLGSEINVAAHTQQTTNWEDYYTPARPAENNGTRIIVPIRQPLGNTNTATLEALIYIDGFIFEAKYGRWADDAAVTVFSTDGTIVDDGTYRLYPHKGYIVFNEKQTGEFLLSVVNQPNIAVAAEIVNRVHGQPVVISGAGFMYSTLKLGSLSQNVSTILPEAINVILTPIQPDVNSVFVAIYTFYDLKGRAENNTIIRWFVNDIEKTDIANLTQWDNKDWKFAVSGDAVYFIVQPQALDAGLLITGLASRSLPVRLS